MSQVLPERHLDAACGFMIGGGVMSYHCTRPRGHEYRPADDPEPHYAVEVTRSTKEWEAWHERQQGRTEAEQPATVVITCPQCQRKEMTVYSEAGVGRCGNCGELADFQGDAPAAPEPETPSDPIEAILRQDLNAAATGAMFKSLEDDGFRYWRTISLSALPWFAECVVCARYKTIPDLEPWSEEVGGHFLAEHSTILVFGEPRGWIEPEPEPAAPTRTRPEDQVLPDGDESIPDDQALLIADIEERRKVGINRYGQGHRPFNGRSTVKDWYEEQLDGLVYARSILRAAEADRDTLVQVVAKALDAEHPASGALAEIAVDRIMSWVVAQRLAPAQ